MGRAEPEAGSGSAGHVVHGPVVMEWHRPCGTIEAGLAWRSRYIGPSLCCPLITTSPALTSQPAISSSPPSTMSAERISQSSPLEAQVNEKVTVEVSVGSLYPILPQQTGRYNVAQRCVQFSCCLGKSLMGSNFGCGACSESSASMLL